MLSYIIGNKSLYMLNKFSGVKSTICPSEMYVEYKYKTAKNGNTKEHKYLESLFKLVHVTQ